MTEQTAQKIANVAIGAAALGATYLILRTPVLRRLAVGLAVTGLTGALPAWFSRELQHAWMASRRSTL